MWSTSSGKYGTESIPWGTSNVPRTRLLFSTDNSEEGDNLVDHSNLVSSV